MKDKVTAEAVKAELRAAAKLYGQPLRKTPTDAELDRLNALAELSHGDQIKGKHDAG